ATRRGERLLDRFGRRAVLLAEEPPPLLGIGVGAVEQPAPQPVGVEVLPPHVPAEAQRGVGVRVPAVQLPGALAALEGQRLTQLDSTRAGEGAEPAVACRKDRVTPEQHLLGAGPDPEQYAEVAALTEEVAVPIPRETAKMRG